VCRLHWICHERPKLLPMANQDKIIVWTIINSMSVKTRSRKSAVALRSVDPPDQICGQHFHSIPVSKYQSEYFVNPAPFLSPSNTHRSTFLPAPARGIRIVLNSAQYPIGAPGHRVYWNFSREKRIFRSLHCARVTPLTNVSGRVDSLRCQSPRGSAFR